MTDAHAMQVVISQSMYFPWVGLLEQVRLADVFVHYDDVQYTRGFFNRVQAKTAAGPSWLTVPLSAQHRGQTIDEVRLDYAQDWRSRHRAILKQAYGAAPHRAAMLAVVDQVLDHKPDTLADLGRSSMVALAEFFGLLGPRQFVDSRSLGIAGASSQRLRDIVRALGGTTYITGHGASNYLDHGLFEASGIAVRYMNYLQTPYPQLHGPFTPFVSALDLIANCGREGVQYIHSETVSWREFKK